MGGKTSLTIPLFRSYVVGDFLFWFCVATTLLSTLPALIHTQNTIIKTSKNQRRKDLISHLKGIPLTCNQGKENYSLFEEPMLIFCHL